MFFYWQNRFDTGKVILPVFGQPSGTWQHSRALSSCLPGAAFQVNKGSSAPTCNLDQNKGASSYCSSGSR
jgi:hypothetical protein